MSNIENIFRFISLRPTRLKTDKERLIMNVYKQENQSPFYNEIKKAVTSGATKEILSGISEKYMRTSAYVNSFQELKFPVYRMMNWIADNGQLTFKKSGYILSLEKIAGKELKDIVKDKDFISSYINLCDSVLADILSYTPVKEKEEKITAIKILFTLKSLADKSLKLTEDELLDDFFGKSTVVFPLLKAESTEKEPSEQKDPNSEAYEKEKEKEREKENERKRRKDRLNNLEKAHREISLMAMDDKFRYVPEENETDNARIRELESQLKNLSEKCRDKEKEGTRNISAASLNNTVHLAKREFILSKKAVGSLNENTKKILTEFHFEPDLINPVNAVKRIEEEMNYIHSKSESDFTYNKMIALGGTYVDKQKFTSAVLESAMSAFEGFKTFIKKCVFKAGIGDLLIVRQTLKAYELAEFAHVENALSGELRERVHRRLDLTETVTDTTTETETEKVRDLQSTERSEMQTEAEKVVQQQAHVDAGLQVSGSYGPSISFTASLNAGFSSSVQETQKKTTSYSREVTEKTSEKVRTKVTEQLRRRILAEIEETNTHRIDNTGTGSKHMRGIYRWLNKIYDAQIFNYGQRMMYEFVIPEPAAYFLYATVENPPADTELIKPEAPLYYGAPLKPSNLTRANYNDYISKYNVTGASEPPSNFTVKTYFDKQDGNDNLNIGRSAAISIPDGYEGYAAVVSSDYVFEEDHSHAFHCMLGNTNWDRTPYWGAEYKNLSRRYRGEISVSAQLRQIRSFSIGVDVFCSLTDEAFAKWQLKIYNAIMQAYMDQKAAYDAKIEQKDIQKGVEILGRNPIENRRIEKEELKKLILMILTNNPYPNINSYLNYPEPVMNLPKVCPNGSFIRFFENAFEWQNILYVFYPYFWGRHAKWINALHLTDPDLDFAAFLKAGAARVQIPVRPGFEKAVAYYCQTGAIWDGNDVPLIGDDLYVPIVKEITENLGKLDDGVPYPEGSVPWEVTVPTSLVVLQDLEEIPNIRDIMTGKNIDLQNKNA